MTLRKVFVVGLDGATLALLRPWAEQGHLPHLSRLMSEGVSGPLVSTFPPLTGPAWASFMTGMSPAQHGVLEFFRRAEGSYRQVLNSRLDIDGRSLWRILSDGGATVGVMGVPMTYPPEPVNGFMLTGLLTPPGARDYAYPRDLLAELEEQAGGYRLHHVEKYKRSDPSPVLREEHDILENNTAVALYLMTHKPWDLFMVHLLGTDIIQHEFWHVMDPTHPQHDPEERRRLGNVILQFFQRVDAALGRLLEALDDQAIVLIMSDHGFGPAHRFINMNTWLLQRGYLHIKRSVPARLRYLLFRAGYNYSIAARLLLRVGGARQANAVGRARREDLQRRLLLSLDDVDWSRTTAYSIGSFGQLYVNLRGREPQGIVSPDGEYEELVAKLAQDLRGLVDPATGEHVVDCVFRRDEMYEGPYADRAPDLMFITADMAYKAMGLADFASPHVFEPVYGTFGHHRMDGLLVCHGKGVIRQGERIDDARIQDLAPTILYAMGQPVPQDMGGRVLTELFAPRFLQAHERLLAGDGGEQRDGALPVYTPEEEAAVRERLRALGYGV